MSAPREIIRENRDAFFEKLQRIPIVDPQKALIKDLLSHGGTYVQTEIDKLVTVADATFIDRARRLAHSDDDPATVVDKLRLADEQYKPYDELNVAWLAFVAVCGGDPRAVRGVLNSHRLYDYYT